MKKQLLNIIILMVGLSLTACNGVGDKSHLIRFNTDGGSEIQSQRVRDGGKIEKPTDPLKEGHTFVNWTYQGEEWSFVGYAVTKDMTLDANWSVNSYTLTLENSIENAGTLCGAGTYEYGSDVTISVSSPLYDFEGWYDSENNLLSNEAVYTFSMGLDQTIIAKWDELDSNKALALGIIPVINPVDKTITYGLYPQTNVNDSSLVTALNALTTPKSNGWYLYEGDYYAKVSATPFESNYVFDNGTTISSGTTYWFKCEPIVWNVLSNNAGQYYIVSSVLLDAHCYYNSTSKGTIDETIYPNNYADSDIRIWLNTDFYNSAFALGNKHILTTYVDNSASTTNNSSNSYACSETRDKVFLPSYQDYINSSYGFSTSIGSTDTRYCRTTDWARARGASYYYRGYGYNGVYWTRSPYSGSSYNAWSVTLNGSLYNGRDGNHLVSSTDGSVRPSLSITIA